MRVDHRPPPTLCGILLLLAACAESGPQAPAAPIDPPAGVVLDSSQMRHIRTALAESASVQPTIRTTGLVHFNGERSTTVLSPISGPVARLLVSLGDEVRPGTILATVASPDFAAAIAEYRKADAAWRNAARIAALNDKLLATGSLPRAERDQSASELVEAAADRAAARATLTALGVDDSLLAALPGEAPATDLSAAIRAPIAGTVVERTITPGQLLEAGSTPTFTLADLSTMWVDANVFAADLAAVQVGDSVTLSSEALTRPLTGRVEFVGALVDPTTRAAAVRIVVPNPDRQLRQNMLVQAELTSRITRRAVVVPVSAVLRDDDNLPYLFIARAEAGRFDRRRITLGARVGDHYEITAGLHAGERIVVEGGLYLSTSGGGNTP